MGGPFFDSHLREAPGWAIAAFTGPEICGVCDDRDGGGDSWKEAQIFGIADRYAGAVAADGASDGD